MRGFLYAANTIWLAIVSMFVAILAPANVASASTLTTLYNFCAQPSCADGFDPRGLVRGADGTLYGVTNSGGAFSGGEVFAIKGRQHKLKILHNFCRTTGCPDGDAPNDSLIMDVNGDLYGTTLGGGKNGDGAVFELIPNANHTRWMNKVLYSFCSQPDCADGSTAGTALTYAGAQTGAPYDGTSPLFGVTSQGGSASLGVAYELTFVPGKTKRAETVLYSFCIQTACSDGETPAAAMTMDGSGNLYGTTQAGGGKSGGLVFKLSPGSGGSFTYSIAYGFCARQFCKDGEAPQSPLIMDGSGNLFGVTGVGGAHGLGVVFKLVPGTGNPESVLYDFCAQANCTDGEVPQASLFLDSDGNLFGTTFEGGAANNIGGEVFELQGKTLSVLYSFCADTNCPDGAGPQAPLIGDGAGNLFGTTSFFGAHSGGTAFELSP